MDETTQEPRIPHLELMSVLKVNPLVARLDDQNKLFQRSRHPIGYDNWS